MAKKTKKTEEITKKFGDERRKALDDALKNIEKDFGKGAVMRLGERAEQKVQVMSSGSLALDIALGAGGYPKGRIIEIKSTSRWRYFSFSSSILSKRICKTNSLIKFSAVMYLIRAWGLSCKTLLPMALSK